MGSDFSIMDRLNLAFKVMTQWETLVTLGAFIALWLLVRYVADPWRASSPRMKRLPKSRATKAPELPPTDDDSADGLDDDDVLPD